MNKYFLSCDWGSSSFRIRLIQSDDLQVIAEEKTDRGISSTYQAWQKTSTPREEYFAAIIHQQINVLAEKTGIALQDVPVLLSGMASSTIGMVELPYVELPFRLDGSDLAVHRYDRFIIISGARNAHDVMRGEETKIIGLNHEAQYLLLPGTHPKHVIIRDQQVVDFKTFMTGEFFDLLSSHSMLSVSVSNDGSLNDPEAMACFKNGLHAGQSENLLHAAFMARTNQILKKISPAHNHFYLSGLLIGAELKSIPLNTSVHIVAGPTHASLYAEACRILDIPVKAMIDADEALIRGQQAVLARM